MATWPESLPQSLLARGYTETRESQILRTKMDVGVDKTRRRTSQPVLNFSGKLILTSAQVDTFWTFFTTTTNGGADVFTWVHPRSGVSTDFRFAAGVPSANNVSNDSYELDINLEVLPT